MLGKHSGLDGGEHTYLDHVGRDSFYGWLASQRGELFRDEEFAGLYVLDNGRPSVPPSLLATALVLQTYDGVSDDEAKQRADYDLRWKVALGVELDARPFAKSTLQEFRAQLIVHEQAAIFQKSLELARRRELPESQAEGGAGHDQHPGAGGGEGHLQPAGGWDREARWGAGCHTGHEPEVFSDEHGLHRYFGSSLKGEAEHRLGRSRGEGSVPGQASSPTPTSCWR